MLDEIKRNLDKATGELIERFANFDKKKALHLKLGLDTLHNAQRDFTPDKKVNLYTVSNPEMLDNLLEEHGVSREEFQKVSKLIESGNLENLESLSGPLREAILNLDAPGRQNYEVPTSGMVAVMFNMVQEKVKNALMAGQAGVRTLKALDNTAFSQSTSGKDALLKDTLYDHGDTKRPARPYIGSGFKEPEYLTSAKAIHHLADLFESSLQLHPLARNFDSIAKSREGFNKLAACIFRHAAENLQAESVSDAADKINALATHVEGVSSATVDIEQACAVVDSGMKILREAMYFEGIISQKEAEDYDQLVNMRVEQIKKLEMV